LHRPTGLPGLRGPWWKMPGALTDAGEGWRSKSVEETFPEARAGKKGFCTSVLITVVPYSATVY